VTLVMGILNVTPDSFSDGGRFADTDAAIARGLELRDAGADLVDVGGESTRPGASKLDPEDERARVIPVVEVLAQEGVEVSIDTMNASTALAAIEAGARMVNDVSGGLGDEGMARVIVESDVRYSVMHWRGGADVEAAYADVVAEVRHELKVRLAELIVRGVDPERIVVDPGLGFAKDATHNWALLTHLSDIASLGHDVLVGASRKRFLSGLLPEGAPIEDRDLPTAVLSALVARQGAWAVRVHDVASTRLALDATQRILEAASR
jgi:dihydropteroate synthase